MTEYIKNIIKEKLPDYYTPAIALLQYATPTSGKNLEDKVLFFVFLDGNPVPSLCVKTVRNYGARAVIENSFTRLQELNTLVAGSEYEEMFAKALLFHDDGEQIVSIETICPGSKKRFDQDTLAQVIGAYSKFQYYIAQKKSGSRESIATIAEEYIKQTGLSTEDQEKIKKFFLTMSHEGIVPHLMQHGDLTEDNIVIRDREISVIDCDFAGLVALPGFDIFGLLYRFSPAKIASLGGRYFPEYFKKIGAEVPAESYRALYFLYFIIERTIRKPYLLSQTTAENLITDFEKHLPA